MTLKKLPLWISGTNIAELVLIKKGKEKKNGSNKLLPMDDIQGCKNNCPYCEVPNTTNDLKGDHLLAVLKTLNYLMGSKDWRLSAGNHLTIPTLIKLLLPGTSQV